MRKSAIKNIVWKHLNKTNIELIYYGSDGDDLAESLVERNLALMAEEMGAEWYSNGATKAVFAFEDLPEYVVKIPFAGYYISDDIDSDKLSRPFYDFSTVDFKGADDLDDNSWDYCKTEAAIYNYAISDGVEKFFAGTWYIGDYSGIPIYVSEKVEGLTVIKEAPRTICSDNQLIALAEKLFPSVNLSFLLDNYTEKEVYDLLYFIEYYDISDLNINNYRYVNNKIKIIDYSSYRD